MDTVNNNIDIDGHYKSLGESFVEKERRHDEMVLDHMTFLLKYFNCNVNDQVVEMGAGTCICSRELTKLVTLEKPIICVDKYKSMLLNASNYPGIVTMVSDAIEFSKLDFNYDKMFCRAFLHHLGKEDASVFLSNVYKQLNTEGIFVNIAMDNCRNRPWFQKLKNVFPRTHIEAEFFVKTLKEIGFKEVDKYIRTNTVIVSKHSLFRSFRERYVSIMQFLSDEDIEEGITEIDQMYPDQEFIQFEDEYFFVVAKK